MPTSPHIPTLSALFLTLLTTTAHPQGTAPALPASIPPPHWPVDQYLALLAPHDPTPAQKAQTTRLINDLTADDYQTRQRASKELAARGADAFPGLRKAVAASNSEELKLRTAVALAAQLFDVPPDTPIYVRGMVHEYENHRDQSVRYPDTDIVYPSLYGVNDLSAELFLHIIIPQEPNPHLNAVLIKMDAQRARGRARLAIAQGDLDHAQQILLHDGNIPGAPEDYAALRFLRVGQALDIDKERAALPPAYASTVIAEFFRQKGDYAEAARLRSLASPFPAPATSMYVLGGQYDKLAAAIQSLPKRDSYERRDILCYLVTENRPRAQATLDAIIRGNETNPQLKQRIPLDLLYSDRAAEAIPRFPDNDWQHTAFHLLCAQLRIREALATIKDRAAATADQPRDLCLLGLFSAAQNLLRDMHPQEPRFLDLRSTNYFAYATQWALAGRPDLATHWRDRGFMFLDDTFAQQSLLKDRIAQETKDADAAAQVIDPRDARTLIAADKIRQRIHTDQFALDNLQKLDDATSLFELDPLDPDLSLSANHWYSEIIRPHFTDPRKSTDLTVRFFQNKLTPDEISPFLDAIAQSAAPLDHGSVSQRDLDTAALHFHLMHHDEWTIDLVNRCYARRPDPACFIPLADLELQYGNPARAAALYQQAAVQDITNLTLMYRLGFALSRSPDTQSDGRRLMAYAPLLVLADDDQAVALADTIRRFQGDAAADAWFTDFTLHFGLMNRYESGLVFAKLRDQAEARGDFAAALDLQRKILFNPAGSEHYRYDYAVEYMLAFAHYHRLRALDALTRRDFPTLIDALNRSLDDGPPNIPLLQQTLPALRTADPAAATALLTRARDRLAPIVHDYPTAEPYRTQLATLTALASPP